VTALVFDQNEVDEIEDWASCLDDLGESCILWLDLDSRDEDEIRRAVEELGLAETSANRLTGDDTRPFFSDFDRYLHVTAFAPVREDGTRGSVAVDCLVSETWVLTVHEKPVDAFDEVRERFTTTSGDVGRLDGIEFLADLLSWLLEAYLVEFEAIELSLEQFDERAMRGRVADTEEELANLVEVRQQIGRLRRALVSHRGLFLALAHPELEAITSSDHSERFATLRGQLEEVVQVAQDSREAVFGSFDVLIARMELRTNEIMKILTLGALLFLPGALVAAVLGMNFRVGFFETGWYFWVVCAGIGALAVATVALARAREWI
jgi:Mg2+ and Co2+ transporter CorA